MNIFIYQFVFSVVVTFSFGDVLPKERDTCSSILGDLVDEIASYQDVVDEILDYTINGGFKGVTYDE